MKSKHSLKIKSISMAVKKKYYHFKIPNGFIRHAKRIFFACRAVHRGILIIPHRFYDKFYNALQKKRTTSVETEKYFRLLFASFVKVAFSKGCFLLPIEYVNNFLDIDQQGIVIADFGSHYGIWSVSERDKINRSWTCFVQQPDAEYRING